MRSQAASGMMNELDKGELIRLKKNLEDYRQRLKEAESVKVISRAEQLFSELTKELKQNRKPDWDKYNELGDLIGRLEGKKQTATSNEPSNEP
jgi:preprotein translocase subunit Sss1